MVVKLICKRVFKKGAINKDVEKAKTAAAG
jgi:hypothetical protein